MEGSLWMVVVGLLVSVWNVQAIEEDNLRPVIGVLAQHPSDSLLDGLEDKNFTSYIAASYIKYLESAGARVVPILTYETDEYYEKLAQSLNGILFPGGAASLTNSSGYGAAGRKLYDHVIAANKNGIHLPMWGTCLGFELITYLAAGNKEWLANCSASNQADYVILQPGFEFSQIFQQMPLEIAEVLTTQNVTANFHKWCITPQNFTESGLSEDFINMATSLDANGLEYVAMLEHRTLPIFGTQFHPEKNPFEWADDNHHDAIPHTPEAIDVAQYFANFFVNQARMNNQKFGTLSEEESSLIYNYSPYYVGKTGSSFMQVYLFRNKSPVVVSDFGVGEAGVNTSHTEGIHSNKTTPVIPHPFSGVDVGEAEVNTSHTQGIHSNKITPVIPHLFSGVGVGEAEVNTSHTQGIHTNNQTLDILHLFSGVGVGEDEVNTSHTQGIHSNKITPVIPHLFSGGGVGEAEVNTSHTQGIHSNKITPVIPHLFFGGGVGEAGVNTSHTEGIHTNTQALDIFHLFPGGGVGEAGVNTSHTQGIHTNNQTLDILHLFSGVGVGEAEVNTSHTQGIYSNKITPVIPHLFPGGGVGETRVNTSDTRGYAPTIKPKVIPQVILL